MEKGDGIARRLTADLQLDPACEEVQAAVREWVAFNEETNKGLDMGANYWSFMAECYLHNTAFIEGTDRKYGAGAARFIGRALTVYIEGK